MTAMQMLLIVAAIVGIWASICAAALLHDRRTSGVGASDGKVDCTQSPMGEGGGVDHG